MSQKQRAGKKESVFFTEVMIVNEENASESDFLKKKTAILIFVSNC